MGKSHGGPLNDGKSYEEFWTNEDARELVRQKMRYYYARWGHHKNLAMFEFFNENPIPTQALPHVVEWYTSMSSFWKKMDHYGHIVTTSNYPFKGEASKPAVYVKGIDVGQVHDYVDTSTSAKKGGPLAPFLRAQLLAYRKLP